MYLSAIPLFCVVALINPSIGSGEFDLEPTPLGYQPFILRHGKQARGSCGVTCTDYLRSLGSSVDAASDAVDAASSNVDISEEAFTSASNALDEALAASTSSDIVYTSLSRASDTIREACGTADTTIQLPIDCPIRRSSELLTMTAAIAATPLALEHSESMRTAVLN